jgi:hypothetical protein
MIRIAQREKNWNPTFCEFVAANLLGESSSAPIRALNTQLKLFCARRGALMTGIPQLLAIGTRCQHQNVP